MNKLSRRTLFGMTVMSPLAFLFGAKKAKSAKADLQTIPLGTLDDELRIARTQLARVLEHNSQALKIGEIVPKHFMDALAAHDKWLRQATPAQIDLEGKHRLLRWIQRLQRTTAAPGSYRQP